MKIDEISGFAHFGVEDLSVAGEYIQGSSFEDTRVKFKMGMKTCPLDLHVKASAEFVTWMDKLEGIRVELSWVDLQRFLARLFFLKNFFPPPETNYDIFAPEKMDGLEIRKSLLLGKMAHFQVAFAVRF